MTDTAKVKYEPVVIIGPYLSMQKHPNQEDHLWVKSGNRVVGKGQKWECECGAETDSFPMKRMVD
jgi:hypothetical protein